MKTILLVEDEAIIAAKEKRILEEEGYNVIHCFKGDDAVTFSAAMYSPVILN